MVENNIIGLREEPKSHKTQYEVQNEEKLGKFRNLVKTIMMN